MSLPLSGIVNVNISLAPTAAGLQGFGPLLLLSEEATGVISATERVRKYRSAKEVLADFPAGEVATAASVYFSQTPTPLDFHVGLVDATLSTPAVLLGGYVADEHSHATLETIVTGVAFPADFVITVDSTTYTVSSPDFAGAESHFEVAAMLETYLLAEGAPVSVGYIEIVPGENGDSKGRYTVTTNSSGDTATLDYADGLLGAWFALNDSGTPPLAILTQGSLTEPIANAYVACFDASQAHYGVDFDKAFREDSDSIATLRDVVVASKRILFNTTNDPLVIASDDSGIAYDLLNTSDSVLSMYSSHPDEYPTIAFAGRAFSTNFEARDSAITMNLKKLNGVTPEVLNTTQDANLKLKNVNAYTTFGGNPAVTDGRMADGTWFDTIHGTDWLKDRIQKDSFNLLYRSSKVAYTDAGVGKVIQVVDGACRQAVVNGLCAPGDNANGEYLEQGYKITTVPVADVGASQKSSRIYSGISFELVGAGALHGITISGTFSE